MDKKMIRQLFTLYVTFICGLISFILVNNYDRLNSRHLNSKYAVFPFKTLPFFTHLTKELKSNSHSQYRGTPSRSGYYGRHQLIAPLVIRNLYSPINIGIHGASKASPTIDDTGIYIGSDTSWFYAFDLNGKIKWKFYVNNATNGIHSSAALDERDLYFGDYKGNFYSIQKNNGDINWVILLGNAIGSSPLIFQDKIFISVETTNVRNGYVICLNKYSGQVIWRSPNLGEQPHSSPSLDLDNRLILVGANNSTVQAFDIDNGELRWKTQENAGPIRGTISISSNKAFYVTKNGKLISRNTKTGGVLWSKALDKNNQTSVLVVKDLEKIYLSTRKGIYSYSYKGKLNWKFAASITNGHKQSLSSFKTPQMEYHIIGSCMTDQLCLLDAKSGKLIWKQKLQSNHTGEVVIYKNKAYLSLNRKGGLIELSSKKQI